MRKFKWMGKLFCLCLLVATLAISASAAENTTEFAGGEGTEASPYLIANATHLNNVRNYLGAHYKMTADIVFTEADFAEGGAFYNNGKGWLSIGDATAAFAGTFDGDGHTIKGLKQTTTDAYGGLFGRVYDAIIKNLGMIDSAITGARCAGGILAVSESGAIINCYNTGYVSAERSAGGLIGWVENWHSFEI